MNKITCPACGSDKIEKSTTVVFRRVTQGPEFSYQQENCTCKNCNEEGDFACVNDAKYLEAYNAALADSVRKLISDLSEKHGISMALFERVFELPMRTLTRWKNGEYSAAAVALLRLAVTFPWLTDVAENRFEVNATRKIAWREAVRLLGEAMSVFQREEDSSEKVDLLGRLTMGNWPIVQGSMDEVAEDQSLSPVLFPPNVSRWEKTSNVVPLLVRINTNNERLKVMRHIQ